MPGVPDQKLSSKIPVMNSCLSWHSIHDSEGTCAFPLGDSSQYSPLSAGCKRDTKPAGTGGGIGFPSVSLGIPSLLLSKKTCTGFIRDWNSLMMILARKSF